GDLSVQGWRSQPKPNRQSPVTTVSYTTLWDTTGAGQFDDLHGHLRIVDLEPTNQTQALNEPVGSDRVDSLKGCGRAIAISFRQMPSASIARGSSGA
ncbi:hypothetical protein, partial [Bosea massiliensis]